MDTNEFDTLKKDLIEQITEAENEAKKLVELSVKQDLFELKQSSFNNEKVYDNLIKKYFNQTLKSYNEIGNLYKASKNKFEFINNEANNSLTNDDRLDFIAITIVGFLEEDVETKEEIEIQLNAVEQMQNIYNIVFETRLLELKCNGINKLISERINTYKTSSSVLSANQKALIAIYTNQIITRKKDGNNTYNKYTYFSNKQNRIGNESTEQKLKNKIKLFESIEEYLTEGNSKAHLLSEIQTLKTKL